MAESMTEDDYYEKEIFGGLSHLMYSDKDLANSMLTGADGAKNHWTSSTKSESEEERAVKFSLHLKRIKKSVQTSLKEQERAMAVVQAK